MNILDQNQASKKNEVLLGEVEVTGKFDFMDGELN
jgi:hypothetical protein